MSKFVIERQYLVPMYQHIVVEADTFEKARELAMSDDIPWDSQQMDCDNARATTLTAAKAIPDRYRVDPTQQQVLMTRADPVGIGFASFLYSNETGTGPLLDIPLQYLDDN
jgi:hypothetical protein